MPGHFLYLEHRVDVTIVKRGTLNSGVEGLNATSPTPVHRVVIAAEPITSVDVTSADALAELDAALKTEGIELDFAELKDPVKDKLRRFGLFDLFAEDRFFPTKESAVSEHVRRQSS